jgi:biopolymer transport protein ExbD
VARLRKEEPAVDIAVPIVPMLDMSFQLLAFFILTFNPRPAEGQLSINLPKLDASTEPPPMIDQINPEEKKDEYTITLNSSADGGIANISMKGPTGESPEIKTTAELLYQLEKITPPAGRKREEGISITIEADENLTYARLIEVMNKCKTAGYETVNLMPLRKERS